MRQKNYTSYGWKNQTISGKRVNSVNVRIFTHGQPVSENVHQKLISTDGEVVNGKISNYTYAILSTGISRRWDVRPPEKFYLHINLFIGENFNELDLNKLDFLGKVYVLDSLVQHHTNAALRKALTVVGFVSHMETAVDKIGGNFENIYNNLINLTKNGHYDTADSFMIMYNVPAHYRAIFWRELFKMAMSKELIS